MKSNPLDPRRAAPKKHPAASDTNETDPEFPFGKPEASSNVVPIRKADVPLSPEERPGAFVHEHKTDTGNARRMKSLYGNKVRWCPTFKCWFVWDDQVWARDETLEIMTLAKKTVLTMHKEALLIEDDAKRNARVGHCLSSEGTGRLRAMVENLRNEVIVTPLELDSHPLLMSFNNGTLNVKTNVLHAHRRSDFITLMVPDDWDEDATHPWWEEVLDNFVRPDGEEKEAFLQRAAYASMRGDSSDKAFINLFDGNEGDTGKTTFAESLLTALGPYGGIVTADSFLLKPNGGGGIRADLATMAGKRMVLSGEVPYGRRLDADLMKRLTQGTGDYLFERKYENPWRGPITFTIWLDGNGVAKARAEDSPLFNRWKLTPFKHQIKTKKIDRQWLDRAKGDPRYRMAVLAWAMRGRQDWMRQGIGSCPLVDGAIVEAKESMDPLAQFWEDCCEFGSGLFTPSAVMTKTYSEWVQAQPSGHEINKTDFEALLRGRYAKNGTGRVDGVTTRGWKGVQITESAGRSGEPHVKWRPGAG